jgi:hypothetical protein
MRFVTPVNTWYAIKLNNITTYLGIGAQEDDVLNNCINWGFNWVQFYGLYTVLGGGTNPNTGNLYTDDLAAFITKTRTVFGINRIGAIMGSGTAGFSLALAYSAAYPNAAFNDYNKENEFWNYPAPGTETFAAWNASMIWLRAQVSSPDFISAYIANPGGAQWGVSEAKDMINSGIDYFETTNYTTYTGPPSNPANAQDVVDDSLKYLAAACITIGATQRFKFNDLMSAEPGFQGPYFTDHGVAGTFAEWRTQYAAINYTGKGRAINTGFNVFSYDDLEAAL